VNCGPFEVIEPKFNSEASSRYEDLFRTRAAVPCLGRAGRDWLNEELDALNSTTVSGKFYDVRGAIYLNSARVPENIELIEGDRILRSDNELDAFLAELHTRMEGAAA
jgi:hypothetical protein